VAFAQEKKEKTLALKALAPAVQKTIQAELKGGETMYEAAYTTKAGKKHEVLVQADGAETKD
jgi:transcriptional antiterminator Rof (Rho-off)